MIKLKKEKIIETVKFIGSSIASIGAGIVIENIAKAYTPIGSGKIKTMAMGLGVLGLSGLVGEAAGQQIEKEIDQIIKIKDIICHKNEDIEEVTE